MLTYNFPTILLVLLNYFSSIAHGSEQQQSCFVYPLEQISPNKTVHFATSFKGNYYEASNYCRRHCMHLISINSQIEQKGIENYLKNSPYKNENFWTSGNDLGEEGVFTWGSTGERLTYTNWLQKEPNNVVRNCQGENCLHLWDKYNYQWNDLQCSEKYYFICEIRL